MPLPATARRSSQLISAGVCGAHGLISPAQFRDPSATVVLWTPIFEHAMMEISPRRRRCADKRRQYRATDRGDCHGSELEKGAVRKKDSICGLALQGERRCENGGHADHVARDTTLDHP